MNTRIGTNHERLCSLTCTLFVSFFLSFFQSAIANTNKQKLDFPYKIRKLSNNTNNTFLINSLYFQTIKIMKFIYAYLRNLKKNFF